MYFCEDEFQKAAKRSWERNPDSKEFFSSRGPITVRCLAHQYPVFRYSAFLFNNLNQNQALYLNKTSLCNYYS